MAREVEEVPDHGCAGFVSHVPSRVMQERDEVIGRVGDDRVLEVEQADPRGTLAFRQPDQVLGVEVPQGEHRGFGRRGGKGLVQAGDEDFGIAGRGGGRVPFEDDADEVGHGLGREPDEAGRRRRPLQRREGFRGGDVERSLARRVRGDEAREDRVAEVLEEEKAVRDVPREEPWSAEAERGEMAGDGDERRHILAPVPRGVHEDSGFARGAVEAEIPPVRGVAGERRHLCRAPSGASREGGDEGVALRHARLRRGRGRSGVPSASRSRTG